MYLIYDDCGSIFQMEKNYDELKKFYIDELIIDYEQNFNNVEIVEGIINSLKKLASVTLYDYNIENYIVNDLKAYGYTVIHISSLESKLRDLHEFLLRTEKNVIVNENDDVESIGKVLNLLSNLRIKDKGV